MNPLLNSSHPLLNSSHPLLNTSQPVSLYENAIKIYFVFLTRIYCMNACQLLKDFKGMRSFNIINLKKGMAKFETSKACWILHNYWIILHSQQNTIFYYLAICRRLIYLIIQIMNDSSHICSNIYFPSFPNHAKFTRNFQESFI